MKFGLNVLNFGPGADPELLRRWALFAENSGYHFLMISDHVAITPDVHQTFPAPFYDPFVSLAWLAAQTSWIDMGTTVTILPYRSPLLTARMAANIEQFSNGRFILGVGVGWAKQEFAALNVPFATRGELANEYLEVILACWTSEVVSYKGKHISFEDVRTGPQPSRLPPVWVGGRSPGAIRRAVRYGDAWHPYDVSIDWLRTVGLPALRTMAASEGLPAPPLCPRIVIQATQSKVISEDRKAGHGTYDQIRADLEVLMDLGATHVLLDTYSGNPRQTLQPERDWEMLTELAERVLDLENQSLR